MSGNLWLLEEQGDFQRCIEAGEALLGDRSVAPAEMAGVHRVLCRARLGLMDFVGAVRHGEEAVRLARQAHDAAAIRLALFDLGVAYLRLRRYGQAISTLQGLLAGIAAPKGAAPEGAAPEGAPPGGDSPGDGPPGEGPIRHELGLAHMQRGEYAQAEEQLSRARAWFDQHGQAAAADRCRRALVQTLLRAGARERVASLLREGDAYLATTPGDDEARTQQLLSQAEYLYAGGDYARAVQVALAALNSNGHEVGPTYEAYMLLHKAALALGHHRDALGFALSARMAALDGQRYDLQYQATVAMIELLRAQGPELLAELDRLYRKHGIDIYQYVPESAARRPPPPLQ